MYNLPIMIFGMIYSENYARLLINLSFGERTLINFYDVLIPRPPLQYLGRGRKTHLEVPSPLRREGI